MPIIIASAITPDRLDFLYILIGSVKAHKKPDTAIDYYVFIPYTSEQGHDYYADYFKDLTDDKFHIYPIDATGVIAMMGDLPGARIVYTRCLFPVLFRELEDRILYLDSDVLCCKDGIEEFWETDLTDCYAAVVQDPAIMWTERYQFERDNTGLTRYFNSGVMLFNLKEIRANGMDKTLEDWCNEWNRSVLQPYHHDQTLMNWLFQGHVKWMPWTYNNQVLTSWGYKVASYERQAAEDGYHCPLETVKDTLFMHFCDHSKPWHQLPYPDEFYPYMKESRALWQDAVNKYSKKKKKSTYKTITITNTTL